jgi:pimeloyl-ACP methyl ester carboxylesterase
MVSLPRRFRRLASDYERLPEILAGMHYVAFVFFIPSRRRVPSGLWGKSRPAKPPPGNVCRSSVEGARLGELHVGKVMPFEFVSNLKAAREIGLHEQGAINQAKEISMADFVFVHGAWHGAWCWKKILPGLWSAGHRAFPVTLTGTGERAHQLSPGITLRTHIDDAAAVIEAEELRHPIVVGHSYGGMVITALADRMPERIARLVYLDAIVPLPGECWSSTHAEQIKAQRRQEIAATGCILPPSPAVYGLSGEDAQWVARRQTPHPGGV